jgi:hypothetical protein
MYREHTRERGTTKQHQHPTTIPNNNPQFDKLHSKIKKTQF